MYKLVLLRHGESVWNKENRFTGWTDVDLSDKGRPASEGRHPLPDRAVFAARMAALADDLRLTGLVQRQHGMNHGLHLAGVDQLVQIGDRTAQAGARRGVRSTRCAASTPCTATAAWRCCSACTSSGRSSAPC